MRFSMFKSLILITLMALSGVSFAKEDAYVGKIDSGIVITEEMHNTCKNKLNLSEDNVARFKEALFSGNLYNIGPFDALGTLFSPGRWDSYFDCVKMHGVSRD